MNQWMLFLADGHPNRNKLGFSFYLCMDIINMPKYALEYFSLLRGTGEPT